MPRILIFAGAPEADWSSPGLPPVSTPAPAASAPAWRSLPLHRGALKTGFSQHQGLPASFVQPAHFFTLSGEVDSQQSTASSQELLTRFYDHSLALHRNLPSSQLPLPSQSIETTETDSFADTTVADTTLGDSFGDEDEDTTVIRPPLAMSHHLSDIEDIPPAPELLRLAPQTVTVNLVAGVISISPARSITTRWGTELSLVEVLLGDDTRAGFAVTFWIPTTTTTTTRPSAPGSATILPSELQRQDVVLLQNVALHVFRGKVYGQSLRRGLTRTTLLYRRDGGGVGHYRRKDLESSRPEVHPQLVKTRKVWEWVLRFVGGEERPRAGGGRKKGWDLPPDDDTQC
ncbi:hypothetical protein CPLU01_07151 [Colletotrichum plurivorum]|uniref:Nucleic acid-binding protein n=1 Tax=Colletotrichum plurivorum TaxID=2175906 RepID=A0A8H6KFM7_9PEZI|nr:hypothetical protein CPLU01_07151 [Colletotrichum plurivorum]